MEGHETREATKALVQSLWAVLRTLDFIPAVIGSQRGGEGMCADLCFRTNTLAAVWTSRLGQKPVAVVQVEVPKGLGWNCVSKDGEQMA